MRKVRRPSPFQVAEPIPEPKSSNVSYIVTNEPECTTIWYGSRAKFTASFSFWSNGCTDLVSRLDDTWRQAAERCDFIPGEITSCEVVDRNEYLHGVVIKPYDSMLKSECKDMMAVVTAAVTRLNHGTLVIPFGQPVPPGTPPDTEIVRVGVRGQQQ